MAYPVTDLARDGAQRQLLELVKGIDKSRFAPILITLTPGGAMEEDFSAVRGLRIVTTRRQGKFDLLCIVRMALVLRKLHVDVVQPFLTPATLYGLLAALLCRTRVKIVTERASPGNKSTSRGYRFYLRIEDFLSRFADWVVPNSQAGASFLFERGIKPSRIRVIYNGIDFARLESEREAVDAVRSSMEIQPGEQIVGMTARMFPVKNHDVLLRAVALASRQVPGLRLALVGDGPLSNRLQAQARELGLGSQVVFCGEQTRIGPYLSAYDIAAHTSSAEGCCNSILEAMALGKPVVATDVGGNREIIEHGVNGLVVPQGNSEALAQSLVELLNDRAKAQAMGQAAASSVKSRFSIEAMVGEYQRLYEDAFLRKGSSRAGSRCAAGRAARRTLQLCTAVDMPPYARQQLARLLDGPMDWEHLLTLAEFHGVSPLVARNLSSRGLLDRVPEPYRQRLSTVRRQTLYRNILLGSETSRILSHLSDSGVGAIPLKGSVLVNTIYGDPSLRQMVDIDILVQPEQSSKARTRLTDIGYETMTVGKLEGHSFHGMPLYKRNGSHAAVELHWGLADPALGAFPVQEVWERANPLELLGVSTRTLSPEDNLLFLSYHMTKHDTELLKFLCDISELTKTHHATIDWESAAIRARSWGIETAVYLSMKRAQELLGAPVPGSFLHDTRPNAVRRCLLNILVDASFLLSPPRSAKVRSETLALARATTTKSSTQALGVLAEHRGLQKSFVWPRTLAWATTVCILAAIRRAASAIPHTHCKGQVGQWA